MLQPPIRPASFHKQNIFLRELLRTRSASLAAARADVNRGSVYRWKQTDPGFAAAWAVVMATRGLLRSHRREKSHPATPGVDTGAAASPRNVNGFAPACRLPR